MSDQTTHVDCGPFAGYEPTLLQIRRSTPRAFSTSRVQLGGLQERGAFSEVANVAWLFQQASHHYGKAAGTPTGQLATDDTASQSSDTSADLLTRMLNADWELDSTRLRLAKMPRHDHKGGHQRKRGETGSRSDSDVVRPLENLKCKLTRKSYDNLQICHGTARWTDSSRVTSVSTSMIECFHICLAQICCQGVLVCE